jgi:LacI family transcriptional regulator
MAGTDSELTGFDLSETINRGRKRSRATAPADRSESTRTSETETRPLMPNPSQGSEQRATLKHIAEQVGVHVSTVSRALNPATRDLVAPELVERITEAAKALEYRPNRFAMGLRTRVSMTVGVVLPDISNATFPVLVQAIEATLATRQYSTIVAHAETDYPRKTTLIEQLAARQIDGLILTTARRHHALVDFCLETGVPLVMVSRTEEDPRVSSVINDDIASMSLAVRHMVELGHRRIAHLGGPADMSTGALRREGFIAAMREHKLEPSAMVRCRVYTREEGVTGSREIFAVAPDTTAVIAANDLLAIGCLDVIKASGRRCPHDVSVTGHNDMPLVDMIDPPLTTVRINYKQMGSEAASLMLRRLEDPTGDAVMLTLRPKLIVRGSTSTPVA